jgi:hypothetical protein
MDFSTTSVVVPATGEVMATSWPATRLRKLDFPTFVRPKRPIWRRKDLGVLFIQKLFTAEHAEIAKKEP